MKTLMFILLNFVLEIWSQLQSLSIFPSSSTWFHIHDQPSADQLYPLSPERVLFLDLDGDQQVDFIEGIPSIDQIWVTLSLYPQQIIRIAGPDKTNFGTVLTSLQDLNNDGLPDLVIGSPGDDSIYVLYTGQIWHLLSHSEIIPCLETFVLTHKGYHFKWATHVGFGSNLFNIGDIDDDKRDDLVVKSFSENKYFLLWGSNFASLSFIESEINPEKCLLIESSEENQFFANIFQGIGDFNFDGRQDYAIADFHSQQVTIIWGAPRLEFCKTWANIMFDPSHLLINQGIGITDSKPNSYFGWALSSTGDLNGDNYADFCVGDWRNAAVFCILGSEIKQAQIQLVDLLNQGMAIQINNPNIYSTFGYSMLTIKTSTNIPNDFLVGSHGENSLVYLNSSLLWASKGVWQNLSGIIWTCQNLSQETALGLHLIPQSMVSNTNFILNDPLSGLSFNIPLPALFPSRHIQAGTWIWWISGISFAMFIVILLVLILKRKQSRQKTPMQAIIELSPHSRSKTMEDVESPSRTNQTVDTMIQNITDLNITHDTIISPHKKML